MAESFEFEFRYYVNDVRLAVGQCGEKNVLLF